jgi:hypothetical protein
MVEDADVAVYTRILEVIYSNLGRVIGCSY